MEMNKLDQQVTLSDERKLGFAEYGTEDGFPILYCHGSQSSRLEMHYDVSFAVENHLRIIAIDRPGHGLSDFNPEGTILTFSSDAIQLTDQLGIDRFSVAGMSAGSPFALGIAHSHRERVIKAAIISGFAPYNNESKKHLKKDVKAMLGLAKALPFLLKVLLKSQTKQLNKNPKKALQGFLKIMSAPDQAVLKNDAVLHIIENMFKEAFRNGSKGVAHEISNMLVKPWGFALKDIQVPTTFWQGGKDNNVPEGWAELMSGQIKGAHLRKHPEEGHLLVFQHAAEIFNDLKPE